jgi:NTP pyrophosphatase (non-canonical NTP hydrolase)
MSTIDEKILQEIQNERDRQDKKWGEQNHHPIIWLMILGEEVGEANQAMLEHRFGNRNPEKYREEMIQVAAVAVAALESFDRGQRQGEHP